MKVNERANGLATILDVEGEISLRERYETLQESVRRLLDAGRKQILLNLENVPYVDSSGLGLLLSLKKAALVAGAELKLLRPRQKVYGILVGTSLTKAFECFDDEAAAVGSFQAPP